MKLTLTIDTLSDALIVGVSDFSRGRALTAMTVEDATGASDALELFLGDELRNSGASLTDGSHMGPLIEYAGGVYYAPLSDFENVVEILAKEGSYTFNLWKHE